MSALLLIKMAEDNDYSNAEIAGGLALTGAGAGLYSAGTKKRKKSKALEEVYNKTMKDYEGERGQAGSKYFKSQLEGRKGLDYKFARNGAHTSHRSILGKIFETKSSRKKDLDKYKNIHSRILNSSLKDKEKIMKLIDEGKIDPAKLRGDVSGHVQEAYKLKRLADESLKASEDFAKKSKLFSRAGIGAAGLGVGALGLGVYNKASSDEY